MVKHTKAELITEIGRARARLGQSFDGLRRDADVAARVKNSFSSHKAAWIGGAGIAGWVLSRLPARKSREKVSAGKKEGHKILEFAGAGMLIGLLKFLFALSKPFITAFARRKISDFAEKKQRPEKQTAVVF